MSPRPLLPNKRGDMYYTAKITQDPEEEREAYNIEFPDVPGAISCAFSMQEALEYAQDALDMILEEVLEGRMAMPQRKTEPDESKGLFRVDVGARTATALEIYKAKGGLKSAAVAKKMGMSPQSFTRLLKPSSNVSVAMLDRFAKAVGKKLVITFE